MNNIVMKLQARLQCSVLLLLSYAYLTKATNGTSSDQQPFDDDDEEEDNNTNANRNVIATVVGHLCTAFLVVALFFLARRRCRKVSDTSSMLQAMAVEARNVRPEVLAGRTSGTSGPSHMSGESALECELIVNAKSNYRNMALRF